MIRTKGQKGMKDPLKLDPLYFFKDFCFHLGIRHSKFFGPINKNLCQINPLKRDNIFTKEGFYFKKSNARLHIKN